MSTAVLRTSNSPSIGRRIAQRLDLVALVIALPVFLAADWSLAGYGVGALVWIAQATVQNILQAKVNESDNPRTVVGLLAGGSIGRAWFTAAIVLITGLIDERAGLAAILLVMVLFTVYFTTKVFVHLTEEKPAQ